MSSKLIDKSEMVAMQARIFDDLRTGDQVCYLIKRAGQTEGFESVLKLTSGWFVSWNSFREQTLLQVATENASFADQQGQSSFVAYGTPDADSQLDVYEISTDARDKVPPTETSPCWKFFLNRLEDERFTVPEE